MALFTDGPVSSIEDLTARDSQLLNVASIEGIDVTQKIALAQDEIAIELELLLTRSGSTGQPMWGWPEANLESVVVTAPLKRWHALRSLELVYSDAFNSQLNDRYGGKRDQYREMAKIAYDQVLATGLGIASCPVPRAATPMVSTMDGAPEVQLPDDTYFVTTSWINARGEEGASATPATVTTSSCTVLVQPGPAPSNAVGWNVYAGPAPDNMYRQNGSPLAVGISWLQPGGLASSGGAPGTGQGPSYLKPVPRMFQRG